MIDSNVPYLLGAGSGIDSKALVEQLVEIEKSAKQGQIDSKRTSYETKLSDYGLFKSALSTLQSALTTLKNPETFTAKSVSFPDSDVVIPTAVKAGAQTGTFSIEVTNIAKSQSLSSPSFTNITDEVGKGTLTFNFGDWDDVIPPTTFTADTNKVAKSIVIDDTNNTLEGLRDAINTAGLGVQASIVNDGSGFKLLMKAESGENNQLSISVVEDEAVPSDNDATGLSRFTFNETALQMTQQQAGADAHLIMNGLAVTRTTNNITDLIDGFSFTIAKDAPGEVVNISILDDKTSAEDAIRNFVDLYNEFLEVVKPLTGLNEETSEYGSLSRDALAKSMLNKIREFITQPVEGISSGLNALTNLGIRTELDGSISIDETVFSQAFDENYADLKNVFAASTASSADKVKVTGYGTSTVAGTYEIEITQQPEKGTFTGTASLGFPLDTTGKDYSFNFEVNGVATASLALPGGVVYANETEMATAFEQLINSDSALAAAGVKVDVSFDTDHFVFTSNAFGSNSLVSITAGGADIADLGLSVAAGTAGKNVVGMVNGVEAFGLGDVLLPAYGTDAYGLKLRILPGATTASVTFARGIGDNLDRLVTDFLGSQGPVTTREKGLAEDIADLDEDQEKLDSRSAAYQARLQAQFIAMEAIVDSLNSTRDYLKSVLDNLPFTANNN
ncbi:flagellar filament capping protein FliD [Simiduia curdlanivorans]|uniref:Flagellar hook-associated protein 2 n=1 Tax=Simiduia curdlanivorans TaxID=1492769 RepID=A0ABV8V9K9_9GAMM|nr:flagellar filament capping protein FliD [Simiduia curdlanivorans]MDN3639845.1 flagellar filament capping protein FliD [Simiduia curdlanivorans]